MAIGDLLGKLKPSEPVEPEQFLALVLTDEVVQAAVWHVLDGKTELVAKGTPVEWDGDSGTTSELIQAVDATISNATEGLSQEQEKIIFGVPVGWTDKEGIVGSRRELIKKICTELELKPLGFVVLTDSLLKFLKLQEGTPSTSILIQVSRDEIVLLLVRLGRIENQQVVGRSDDIVADVEEGISRFKSQDNLPSRIILFNSMHDLDEIVQTLVSYDWQNKFNFLHIPKIEALPKDIAIQSVAVAGGMEVAKALGFPISEPDIKTIPEIEPPPEPPPPPTKKSLPPVEPDLPSEALAEEEPEHEPEPELDEVPNIIPAEAAGFTVGDNFSEPEPSEPGTVEPPPAPVAARAGSRLPHVSLPKFAPPAIHLPKLSTLPHFSLPKFSYVIPAAIVGVLLLFIVAFVWLLPKATVDLSVKGESLNQSVDLTLDTNAAAVDAAAGTIPAKLISTEETETKAIPATGTKTIGDPAKGGVTVYNRTSLPKTFAKGTVITGNNVKFTLDSDVTVASKSAGANYVDVPGHADVSITAVTFGAEGNLAAGNEFTINSFSKDTYVAKNSAALTGGTSQQVQVVGKDDKAALVKAITDELVAKAESDLQSQAGPGVGIYILQDLAKVTSENYSAKAGDNATELSGTLTVTLPALRYSTADAATLVDANLAKSVPEGYMRTSTPPAVDLQGKIGDFSSGKVTASASIAVNIIPKYDTSAIAKSLAGKNAVSAQSVLSSLPGFSSANIQVSPRWLPPRFKSMPRNPKNIQITVTPL